MAGFADYMAQAGLNFVTGQQPMPVIGNRFVALFTTAPTSDAGTGGTEVSGTGYARIQVAGAVTAAGAISTASPTITMPNVSGFLWVVPGMNVYDLTNNKQIGTVLTWTATTLTLVANAANNGSGSTDSLQFSSWPASTASSGNPEPNTLPASVTNTGATITFAQAGAGGWGTITSWAIFDAVTSGNMLQWDYIGNFKWFPFTCTSASPGVFTTDLSADVPVNGSSVVVTNKFGTLLPTTAGSFAGLLTTAGASGITFNVGVNTTSTGAGEFRQVTSQSIPANVTASFATSTLTLTLA
jgi:hypothetical protein